MITIKWNGEFKIDPTHLRRAATYTRAMTCLSGSWLKIELQVVPSYYNRHIHITALKTYFTDEGFVKATGITGKYRVTKSRDNLILIDLQGRMPC